MSTPMEYYKSIPPVTKTYAVVCLLTTCAYQLELCNPTTIALFYSDIFKRFQVWRLITPFFFLGPFSLEFAMRLLTILLYGVQLERGPFDKRTADLAWMYIFGAMTLLYCIAFADLDFKNRRIRMVDWPYSEGDYLSECSGSTYMGDHSSIAIDNCIKPVEGMSFNSFEDGYEFYKEYARVVGFDTRKQAAKKCENGSYYKWRYACCNRQGFNTVERDSDDLKENESKQLNTMNRRRISRCGCPAKISFKYEGEVGWVIYKFVESHNHDFVSKDQKSFMKVNRKLDDVHKLFIMDCAKVNIGTTDAYNFLCEILGGKDVVGCTLVDMRNFVRDLRAYVKGSDAQMLLNEMKRINELSEDFFYAYDVDGEGRLRSLFWADSISRKNYGLFGDVVAFDTTYSTNRYCMIFAPFTGKDNHGRPVTFACGLLTNEDAESFSWLFTKFKSCMGGAPKLIVTDQDLGMKVAVDRVFSETRHRWCMWHVMVKLSTKVPRVLHGNEQFRRELNKCVWSDLIEPEQFESLWNDVITRYGLENNNWLTSLYTDRQYWIPAYFRDFHMGGIVRTTSISEYENSFFKRFTRCRGNLLDFWMKFNYALESQRMAASKLDYGDQSSVAVMKSSWEMEKNASMLFTANIFYKIQEEIHCSFYSCSILDIYSDDEVQHYDIKDQVDGVFRVEYRKVDEKYICGCKLFSMKGILCRHIFVVLKNKLVNHIPETYICRRWLKSSLLKVQDDEDVKAIESGSVEIQRLSNNLIITFFKWFKRLQGKKDKLSSFLEVIDSAGSSLASDESVGALPNAENLMEYYYGSLPDDIEVGAPNVVKTKGSGSRLVSRQEKVGRMNDKPMRRCAKCGQKARHDARNCGKEKRV